MSIPKRWYGVTPKSYRNAINGNMTEGNHSFLYPTALAAWIGPKHPCKLSESWKYLIDQISIHTLRLSTCKHTWKQTNGAGWGHENVSWQMEQRSDAEAHLNAMCRLSPRKYHSAATHSTNCPNCDTCEAQGASRMPSPCCVMPNAVRWPVVPIRSTCKQGWLWGKASAEELMSGLVDKLFSSSFVIPG